MIAPLPAPRRAPTIATERAARAALFSLRVVDASARCRYIPTNANVRSRHEDNDQSGVQLGFQPRQACGQDRPGHHHRARTPRQRVAELRGVSTSCRQTVQRPRTTGRAEFVGHRARFAGAYGRTLPRHRPDVTFLLDTKVVSETRGPARLPGAGHGVVRRNRRRRDVCLGGDLARDRGRRPAVGAPGSDPGRNSSPLENPIPVAPCSIRSSPRRRSFTN
jgi:hypothetical protein